MDIPKVMEITLKADYRPWWSRAKVQNNDLFVVVTRSWWTWWLRSASCSWRAATRPSSPRDGTTSCYQWTLTFFLVSSSPFSRIVAPLSMLSCRNSWDAFLQFSSTWRHSLLLLPTFLSLNKRRKHEKPTWEHVRQKEKIVKKFPSIS